MLLTRELDSQKSRLQRIQKGGSLAGLKLRYVSPIDGDSSVIKLSDLRRDRGIEKRVVIVAATKELLKSSLATSVGVGQDLSNNDLVIVPLSIDTTSPYGDNSILEDGYSLSSIEPRELLGLDGEGEEVLGKVEHIWSPVALASWNKVIKSEMATALKQQPEALLKGVTIVIKKNGRVRALRFVYFFLGNEVQAILCPLKQIYTLSIAFLFTLMYSFSSYFKSGWTIISCVLRTTHS